MCMRTRAQRDIIERAQTADDMPRRGTYRPQFRGDDVRMTLMMEAVEDAGLEQGDQIVQHYYEDEQMVVIDLGGES